MVDYKEMLAEARAIYLAMKQGAISYEKAKLMTTPYLEIINKRVRKLARKHGVYAKEIRFNDLNRNI
ncbi:hypothetical protein HYW42_00815 [Candidatus Daviesbacteria bacterium]|nr:hypothetical protein [Candidatus Daviesbacteria bacterium]